MPAMKKNLKIYLIFLALFIIPVVICCPEIYAKDALSHTASVNDTESKDVSPAAAGQKDSPLENVGEFFGVPVPAENYYFVKSAIMVFGNKWGAQPRTTEELDKCVWDQLLLSIVAYNKNITVDQNEIDAEVDGILKAEGKALDRKADRDGYVRWIQEKTNEPVGLFENQIRHLIQIKKLRQEVIDSITPEVNEEEARQKFLNQYNTLGLELVQFDSESEADEFYKKVRADPRLWEKQKKKTPDKFKRPGFVSLEFLIDIWQIPSDAAYKMMEREEGDSYPPRPIYKGFGVFKILLRRPAQEADYERRRDYYLEQIKSDKKLGGFNEWFKQLKQEADIKIYKKGGQDE